MKRLAMTILAALVALAIPAVVLAGGSTPLERTEAAGWTCDDIAGAMHCFDPGDAHSSNAASVNVKVYDYEGKFLGTEQLWSVDHYAGQPCPQDEVLDLQPFGLPFMACHHYAQ